MIVQKYRLRMSRNLKLYYSVYRYTRRKEIIESAGTDRRMEELQ